MTGDHLLNSDSTNKPWVVEIRDSAGRVLGGGFVLDAVHVVTCAHVVASASDHQPDSGGGAPKTEIVVDFPYWSVGRERRATAVDGGWVERSAVNHSDVALLRLARELPEENSAPLQRAAPRLDQDVVAYGFPGNLAFPLPAEAVLGGPAGPAGEWILMRAAPPPGPRVTRGYSGSAVVDKRLGIVMGIVVSEYVDDAVNAAFMIPLSTLERSVPRIKSIVDRRARRRSRADLRLREFLTDREQGGVMVVVDVGKASPGVIPAPSPARSASISHQDLKRITRTPGMVDLTLDVAGLSADHVAHRILDGFGLQIATQANPILSVIAKLTSKNLMFNQVDAAADPKALVRTLLCPLVERSVREGNRVVIGFREEAASIRHRIDLLRVWLGHARALEEEVRRLAALVTSSERFEGPTVTDLRLPYLELRLPDNPVPTTLRGLEEIEVETLRETRGLERSLRRLEELLDQRDEQRGLLDAYRDMASGCGLAEDPSLSVQFKEAFDSLQIAPCDLTRATVLVHEYIAAVRARCADRGRR